MEYNHILYLRNTRAHFLLLKFGVISTANTARNQGASNESPNLYYKSYFARHFYAVLKLWVTGKCMWNNKSIGAFARLCCFLENCWNLQQFRGLKKSIFIEFLNFTKFLKT